MSKTKISEFDTNPSNNTDIDGINIAEGCAPSGINNAIRELMSQLKNQQAGLDGDNFTIGGDLSVAGDATITGATTFTGAVVFSSTTTSTNATLDTPTINSPTITYEGTADDFETTLAFTDPTADRTITFPDKAGTVAMTSDLPSNTSLTTGSGTYSIAGTTMTVVDSSHGLSTGYQLYCNFTSGTAVDNYFTITVVDVNTFTIAYGSSLTTSGNVTWYYSPKGLISLASLEEVTVGTNTDRAVSPAGVLQAVRATVVQGTAQDSTSGTEIDFTGIPSWAKRVTVMFNGVSLSGISEIIVQLGSGSTPTYKTTDYVGCVSSASGGSQTAFTNGFQLHSSGVALNEYYGAAYITNFSSNTWCSTSELASAVDTTNDNGAGVVDLGATLTAIRVTTLNGTDTFDAGSINIIYE